MAKSIVMRADARRALERGIDALTDAVAVTLGPRGRNVVLEKQFGAPYIVNDGITIAREIELEDHLENTGAALIREAAAKTNDVGGDGTTTAAVLARSIIKEGLRYVAADINPMALKRGIAKAVGYVVREIVAYSQPVEDSRAIAQVAAIAAGNDREIGQIVAEAMDKVGRSGILTVEEGKSIATDIELTEGMRFDRGYVSPYFITNPDQLETVLEEPLVLCTDRKIAAVQDLLSVLEHVTKAERPLLIIAENVDGEALATLVLNRLRGVLNVCAVKAPGFGDRRKAVLQDIATLTSSKVIADEAGLTLENTTPDLLGTARRVTVTKDTTTIVASGNEPAVRARCQQIERQIQAAESDFEREQLEERLARLAGGVALIKVGAATETEMQDRKLRLEDAINAAKAAIEEGIVPGGGATFVHISPMLESWVGEHLSGAERYGGLIVAKALEAPLRCIVENAGVSGAVVVDRVKNQPNFSEGFDAELNHYVDLIQAGILDTVKVTRAGLQNAASIAEMVLTTEAIVVQQPDSDRATAPIQGGVDL
ncbi:MAG: chaperonin GroEL [Synechococcus sp.]